MGRLRSRLVTAPKAVQKIDSLSHRIRRHRKRAALRAFSRWHADHPTIACDVQDSLSTQNSPISHLHHVASWCKMNCYLWNAKKSSLDGCDGASIKEDNASDILVIADDPHLR